MLVIVVDVLIGIVVNFATNIYLSDPQSIVAWLLWIVLSVLAASLVALNLMSKEQTADSIEAAPKTRGGTKYSNRLLPLTLSIPLSLIYGSFLQYISTNWFQTISWYVFMGITIGALCVFFKAHNKQRLAFLLCSLTAVLAYALIFTRAELSRVGIIVDDQYIQSSPISGFIPIATEPYVNKITAFWGYFVYAIVITGLVVPFGILGIQGVWIAQKLGRAISKHVTINNNEAQSSWSNIQVIIGFLVLLNAIVYGSLLTLLLYVYGSSIRPR